MKAKLFFLLLCFLAFQVAVVAQGSRGGTTGSTTPSPDRSKGPEGTTDIGKYANMDTLSRQGRSGDYLLGNVIVAGGALPWDPIPVTVSCEGKTLYTAGTDPKGNFQIVAVEVPGATLGTEGAKSKPASAYIGCSVQAALPGFDSNVLTISNRNILDNPDIGTITLNREQRTGGAAVSSTTAS